LPINPPVSNSGIAHAKAQRRKEKILFFSADPRGIGSAFHGAGTAEKK